MLGACQILNSPFIDQSLIIYTTKIIDYLITNLKSLEEETGKLNKEIYKPNPMNEEVSEDENKDYLKESYDEFDNDNKVIDTEVI